MQAIHVIAVTTALALLAICATADPQIALPAATPSKIQVAEDSLTFDPKSCTPGRACFDWTWGRVCVEILGREGNRCLFKYVNNVELGETHYQLSVPVDSGPVTIKIGEIKEGNTTTRGVLTSFPLDKATVLRRGVRGLHWSVLVGNTGEFVDFWIDEYRSEMFPRKGDKVKLRFYIYDGPEFTTLKPNAATYPAVEFALGAGTAWPWLEAAIEEMSVGDRRRVQVPIKIAAGARAWVPAGAAADTLYLEMRLVSLERAK